MSNFLDSPGDFKNLIAYKKAICVYDGTKYFTQRFLKPGDRTIGQMEQVARSGKQNIVEGNVDGATSTYSNIHLINIALGSLDELKEDYIDYLRTNNLRLWELEEDKCKLARAVCAKHNEPEYYIRAFEARTAETIANIMIVVIMQCIKLTGRLLASRKEAFLKNGGKKEEMYRMRKSYRNHGNDSYDASEPEVDYGNSDELPY